MRSGAGTGLFDGMLILRHGQSEFNAVFSATGRDPGITDPGLTALGHAQAGRAARDLAGRGVRRILVSPYTRAIETARHLAAATGLALEVTPMVRERVAFVCDIGSPRSVLALRFPELDLASLDEVWWTGTGDTQGEVAERAQLFLARMRDAPDHAGTVVVCHWGFALALTGRGLDNGCWIEIDPEGAIRE